MFKHTLTSLLRRAVLALLIAAGGHASAGTIHVEIDTAGFGAARAISTCN